MGKMIHEMLHFKSYNALQITSGESPELREYRVGLTVHTRDGKNMYFVNLNEAITEEITKALVTKLFDNELFVQETRRTKSVVRRYPRAVTNSGEPLFDDDTFYADVDDKKSWREAVGRVFGVQENPRDMITERFTYQPEREVLNTLINKINERNPEQFQDRKEVFEVFAKGMITGNILPIGRLIERTFGAGTLRRIGELDEDVKAQQEFVRSL